MCFSFTLPSFKSFNFSSIIMNMWESRLVSSAAQLRLKIKAVKGDANKFHDLEFEHSNLEVVPSECFYNENDLTSKCLVNLDYILYTP